MTSDYTHIMTISEEATFRSTYSISDMIKYTISNLRSRGYNVDMIKKVPGRYEIYYGYKKYAFECTKLKSPTIECSFGLAGLEL